MEQYNEKRHFVEELLASEVRLLGQAKRTVDGKLGILFGRIGRAGFSFNYVPLQHETRVELLLQTEDAKNELHRLKQNRHAIEAAFGSKLDWLEKAERRQCRVVHVLSGGYRSPRSEWPNIHHNLVDAMKRLEAALATYIGDAPATYRR
jgi:hypothetical protein